MSSAAAHWSLRPGRGICSIKPEICSSLPWWADGKKLSSKVKQKEALASGGHDGQGLS
jgi:hypothetical protein